MLTVAVLPCNRATSFTMSRGLGAPLVLNGAPLAAHAFTALPIAAARAVAHERGTVEDPLAKRLLLGAGGAKGKALLHEEPTWNT